jgi:hypothetical protein
MTMQAPLAAASARPAVDAGRSVALSLGPHTMVADQPDRLDRAGPDGGRGPTPLELLTGSVAASTAIAARAHLEREGDPADLDVVVTLDPGPPPLLYRRVVLGFRLGPADTRRLADALDRTEVTMMLGPAFTIRTQVEYAGEPLT